MRDWRQLVRTHLPPLALSPEREAEVVDELAQLLEDSWRDQPMADAELEEWIRGQIPEWQRLAREIRRTTPIRARRAQGDLMDRLRQEGRFALRMLIKNPAFTAVAVLILAIAIGLNTAVFSVVNSVLWKSLPVSEPERLASLYTSVPNDTFTYQGMSYPDYEDLRRHGDSFTGLLAHALASLALEHRNRSEIIWVEMVSGNYFETLGLRPALGRALTGADDRPGGPEQVAVLSHAAWQRRFGGDPGVLGTTIRLNGQVFSIVGIAPQGFLGLSRGLAAELWLPIRTSSSLQVSPMVSSGEATPGLSLLEDRSRRWMWVTGRLRADVGLEQARAEVTALAGNLAETYPKTNSGRELALLPTDEVRLIPGMDGVISGVAGALMGIVALVLLIASSNLANMLLARAAGRRKEIATRLALGAGRGAVLRQLMMESLLLASLGGMLGLALAMVSNRLLLALEMPVPVKVALDLSLDVRVLGFTVLIAALTAVAFGLAPALQTLRTDLASTLAGESHGAGGSLAKRRVRRALVVAQVALSLLLLICATLSLRSLWNAHRIDPGFDADGVVAGRFFPELSGASQAQSLLFYQDLKQRVEALPGVESVAYASHVPLSFYISYAPVAADGTETPQKEWPTAEVATVGPGYFDTLGIPLLAGRTFSGADARVDGPRIAVINQTLNELLWPGESAIGRRFRYGGEGVFEVAGVVGNGKYRTLGEAARGFAYFPYRQDEADVRLLLARVDGDTGTALDGIRREARRLDEKVPITSLETLEETLGAALLLPRFGAFLFGLFGAIGLLLASVGIYGVIAYAASQRTHEMGIRLAMGARRRDISRLIVRDGISLAAIGVVFGVAAAAVTTRALSVVLYGIDATDGITFVLVPLAILLVALAASYVPARKASNVDPVEALRHE